MESKIAASRMRSNAFFDEDASMKTRHTLASVRFAEAILAVVVAALGGSKMAGRFGAFFGILKELLAGLRNTLER
jgi:hypothetical protein